MIPQLFVTLSIVVVGGSSPTEAVLPTSIDLDAIRDLPVQHDGRWPPLDTVARDLVDAVTGDEHFRGQDPVAFLLAWTFAPEQWEAEPLITIKSAELRGLLKLTELGATKTVFSYNELFNHAELRRQIDKLSEREEGRKPDALESKVSDISAQLGRFQDVIFGGTIRPVPDPTDPNGRWQTIGALARSNPDAKAKAVTEAWSQVKAAFLADDAAAFSEAASRLKTALSALPAEKRPEQRAIATELRYNKLRPFRRAWIAMAIGSVLTAAALVVRRRWFDLVAGIGLVVGFVLLSYGLWLRWEVAGRIPASNMFESLLFLSWGMGAFAIIAMLAIPHRMVPLTASFMGAVALFLADVLPMDHFVRPIAPVLMDTVWMSIHVPVIMVSYSVLALGVLIAHIQLVVMAAAPGRRPLITAVDTLHYWYIHVGSILLLAGIVTGSMWAASSWGRYWGWDPKEVWSLVALLGYLTILHVRVDFDRVPVWAYAVALVMGIGLFVVIAGLLAPLTSMKVLALAGTAGAGLLFVLARGPFATALKSVLAFWLIIMTYVGVNYVLGIGLHSYGFGTGAVVKYMFLLGGIDLGLAGVLSVVYLLRRPPSFTGTAVPAVGAR